MGSRIALLDLPLHRVMEHIDPAVGAVLTQWTMVRDKWSGNGSCVLVDQEGDIVMTTWDDSASTYSFVGGTGKYRGIAGGGAYQSTVLHDAIDGQNATVVRHTVKWEIRTD